MQPLAVVGPDAEVLVDRLAAHLADRGAVGTIFWHDSPVTADRPSETTRQYDLSADGWAGAGSDCSLVEALDQLAVTCEYGLVAGRTRARLPTVALGDTEIPEAASLLSREQSIDAVDIDALVADIEAVEPYETLESLVADLKASADAEFSGAIATFTGCVRPREDAKDDRTEYLEFEKYDTVAEERMATLREELKAREGVYDVRLHHRTGRVDAGEDIVFVAVLAGHRPEAFRAVEDGINRLKAEVPLFKKEVTTAETFWAHQHQM